jgi:molybdate transport system ATP-binding protein
MPADGSLRVRARVSRGAAGFALDVDLVAPPGVTVLFGPSGSGKSTTLAVIAGLVRPTSGRVTIGETTWFDGDAGVDVPVHRRGVAYVFQSLALFPHMTGIGNVVYGMDRAVGRRLREARARGLLERLRVGHVADRRPATFSGGEAQRVALARALATSPRAILLDEPFSALDRELRVETMTDLRALVREREVPVLFVTHRRDEARALGEHVVVLDGGRVDRTCTVGDLGE